MSRFRAGAGFLATIYHLACDCGAIELEVRGEPLTRVYCHCASCREVYGVELLSASTWRTDNVRRRVAPGADLIAHRQPRRRMWRYHCSGCGRLVHGRNRKGHLVIPNERFRMAADDRLPAELAPVAHCFYDERVIDVLDDLPRYAGESEDRYPDSIDG